MAKSKGKISKGSCPNYPNNKPAKTGNKSGSRRSNNTSGKASNCLPQKGISSSDSLIASWMRMT